MTDILESSVWESGVYQLETDDPVLGGAPAFDAGIPVTGHANAQAQQLANRTQWLKQQVEALPTNYANSSDPAKGASLIGYDGRTVKDKLQETKSARDEGLADDNADGLRAAMGNADFSSPRLYGTLRYINGTGATAGIFDMANFAGQNSVSNIPIGWVFHHYTDGKMIQLDNVGSGTILTLKNARNTVRRPDKPTDHVGTGNYMQFLRDDGTGSSVSEAFINKDLDIVWQTRPITRISGKSDTSSWAFKDSTYTRHTYVYELRQGGQQVFYTEDSGTEYRMKLGSNRTTFSIEAPGGSGVLKLGAGSGQVTLASGSSLWGLGNLSLKATGSLIDLNKPLSVARYAGADLPVLTVSDRALAYDNTADKLKLWNGTEWKAIALEP